MNIKRSNLAKVFSTARPTENDVSYPVPTLWMDTTGDKAYILVDVTSGVATWTEVGGSSTYDPQESVISITDATAAPGAKEVTGARYILNGTPHAGWDGAADKDIVEFDGAVWVATTPTEGMMVEVEDVNTIYVYFTTWTAWLNQAILTTSSPTFAALKVTTGAALGSLVKSDADGDLSYLADVAVGQVLTSGGVEADPVYSATPTVASATLTTAIADNTATTQAATTAFAKGQDAVLAREPDQGVAITAGATATITVADSVHLDHGTGAGFISCTRKLESWTAAAILMEKHDDTTGYRLSVVVTTGLITLTLNDTTYTSTVAPGFAANTQHKLTATWSPGVTNTTVAFYADGVAFGAPADQANETTTDNAVAFYAMGTDAVRTAGTDLGDIIGNFAPTAAEVLDMYRNGIPESWKWGSQTDMIVSSFVNGIGGNALDTFDGESANGYHGIKLEGGIARFGWTVGELSYVLGKRYRFSFTGTATSGTAPQIYSMHGVASAAVLLGYLATGVNEFEFTSLCDNSVGYIQIYTDALDVTEYTVADAKLVEIGATAAYLPENIQPAPGQWLDASSNKLHAMQPAAGSSLTRPKNTFEIRGVNTWAATHEAQSITSLTDDSRAILPVGCYITDIIGVIAGGTIEDIIIGDGSDTDHWVAITTGLAAGTVAFTVANPISDGTNYEMVVDPDANFTGSITWTIRGIILT